MTTAPPTVEHPATPCGPEHASCPPPPSQSITRTRYATSDPLEAREFVADTYGAQLRVRAIRDRGSWLTLDRLQAGEIEFADLDLPLDLSVLLPGQGQYVFSTVIAGAADYERAPGLGRAPGDTYLGITPDGEELARARHLHVSTVSLPARLLDDLSGRDHRQPAVSFTARRPVTGGVRRWRQTVSNVRRLITDLDEDAAPLITGSAARLLAATALSVFPNTALGEPATRDRHDAHHDTLRRAVSFIEASPDLDIAIADVARAACATPRAVRSPSAATST